MRKSSLVVIREEAIVKEGRTVKVNEVEAEDLFESHRSQE